MVSIRSPDTSYIVEPYTILSYDSRKADGDLPNIIVGKYTSIGQNCLFIMAHHGHTRVAMTNSPRMLHSHGKGNPSAFSRGDIHIGNDVWIGANVTILDGITIGDGSVVGAGSVITKDVQPYSIVGGNPAKIIRYRFRRDQIDELLKLQWWNNLPADCDIFTEDIDGFLQKMRRISSTR